MRNYKKKNQNQQQMVEWNRLRIHTEPSLADPWSLRGENDIVHETEVR